MMFGFSGWELGGYRGGVGLRTYLRDNLALRLAGDFGWSNKTDEDNMARLGQVLRYENSDLSLGMGVALEKYLEPAWNVTPLIGVGLFASYENSRHKTTRDVEYVWCRTEEMDMYSVETRLLTGLRWHFTKNLSLGGEYFISYVYTWGEWREQEVRGTPFQEEKLTTRGSAIVVDVSHLWLSIRF
ncbi:hypothetical protein ACFL2Z_01195 [Candidatus Eisenbacteria bacterium]|uniref:Outer membrane protein beta-barrel domain-containing protein n=1 Tax=Eiseniibacteriota bacterium TaxID=2212470 RepID=A0ABV6YN63_UNCEI